MVSTCGSLRHMFLSMYLLAAASATESSLFHGITVALTKRLVRLRAEAVGQQRAKTKAVHKTAYFGELHVGTPAQTFEVVFDTGSGNLLVPGGDCNSVACSKHRRFDKAKSTSVKAVSCDGTQPGWFSAPANDEVTITFGTGEITGRCLQDEMCLGESCSRGSFISATYESENPFKWFAFDGVLGLALPGMSQGEDFNLMTRLSKSRTLQTPLFSVFLSDSDEEPSEITFGQVKDKHLDSALIWAPVTRSSGYWEVQIHDVTLDNQAQELCSNCFVAVDTGTSELAGPSDVIQELTKRVGLKRDCSNYDALPTLGFVVGEHSLNLERQDYVDSENGVCIVNFMPLDVPPPMGPLFVFGIPFLQKFVTVYDATNRRVGFAVAKHKQQGGSRSSALLVEMNTKRSNRAAGLLESWFGMYAQGGVMRKLNMFRGR